MGRSGMCVRACVCACVCVCVCVYTPEGAQCLVIVDVCWANGSHHGCLRVTTCTRREKGTLTQCTRPSRRRGATPQNCFLTPHLSSLSGSMLRQSLCTGCGPFRLSSFWGHLTAVHTRAPTWHGHLTHKSYSCTHSRDVSAQSNSTHTYGHTGTVHAYICTCSARAWMTFPSVERDLLMLAPSLSRAPVAPVDSARSLPARSTRLSLLTFSVGSPVIVSTLQQQRVWAKQQWVWQHWVWVGQHWVWVGQHWV